jgi:chromosome segregation ATPase
MSTGKIAAVTAALVAVFGLQTWSFVSARNTLEAQVADLQQQIQTVRDTNSAQVSEVASGLQTDLQVVSEKIGVTAKELADARRSANLLKQEQAKTSERLANELATRDQALGALREEASTASTKITELTQGQTEAVSKIGAVTGDVQVVKVDLDSTKKDLAASRTEMGNIRDSLGREIAKNSTEVAELRRRGERDYTEFNIPKAKTMERIATGVQIQLKKADTKAQRYDVTMMVDDSKMEKKNLLAKEPIQFLVGRDRLRYELVVYSVDKDRIRGYISMPKDAVLAAEGPRVR